MAMHPDIKKWQNLKKKAKKISDTAEIEHSRAYTNAAKKHLQDNEGNIDYEKLDDSGIQKDFIKGMTDHYLNKAKQHFGANIDKNDKMKVDMLMDAYAGVTSSELERSIKESGKKYSLAQHESNRDSFVGKVNQKLQQTAAGHLKDRHVDDIVKYSKAGHLVDSKKMTLGDAITIHDIYKGNKTISKPLIERSYGKIQKPYQHFMKKRKKK